MSAPVRSLPRTGTGTSAPVLWFTGLSGSGKSTIATRVHQELERELGPDALGAEIFTYAPGQSSEIRVFDGRFGFSNGSFFPFPANYTRFVNMAIGDSNFDLRNDLVVVSGEGPIFQSPRVFFGGTTSPAGFNGP